VPLLLKPDSLYICPVCSEPLAAQPSGKNYSCPKLHSFDCAKEGYLNLLPVQFKHSKEPGDNKQMMIARRLFLEHGFYEPMAKALTMMIDAHHLQTEAMQLLDLGCGEGYYSRAIDIFSQHSELINLHGLDIAKYAIAAAAKKQNKAKYVVASSNRLPYKENYFDFIVRVFAPSDADELNRVLKNSGYLLTVTPGPRHLWQLKEYIYTEVKEHAAESLIPSGFKTLSTQRISYKITPDTEQRMALLQMTPFAWQVNESAQQILSDAACLEIETDFIITLFVKSDI